MTEPERTVPDRRSERRNAYRAFFAMTTRWMDNDPYGHVNNAIYHAWFDTAVNRFLIENRLLDPTASSVIAVMAENFCRYHSGIAYPDDVTIGVRVGRLGRSSVRYESGAFRGEAELASAEGYFVHVYVDRSSMNPVPMPDRVRSVLATIAA